MTTTATTNAFAATAAECPTAVLTLTGVAADVTTYDDDTYTDGFKSSMAVTFAASAFDVMADGASTSALMFWGRQVTADEVTATATPQGAWMAEVIFERTADEVADGETQTYSIGQTDLTSYYDVAATTAPVTEGAVELGADAATKYGAAATVNATATSLVVDGVMTFTFLMPTSNGEAEKVGQTSTSGDRWSADSDVVMFSAVGGTQAVAAVAEEDCTGEGETAAEDCTGEGENAEEDCTGEGEIAEEDCTDADECSQASVESW